MTRASDALPYPGATHGLRSERADEGGDTRQANPVATVASHRGLPELPSLADLDHQFDTPARATPQGNAPSAPAYTLSVAAAASPPLPHGGTTNRSRIQLVALVITGLALLFVAAGHFGWQTIRSRGLPPATPAIIAATPPAVPARQAMTDISTAGNWQVPDALPTSSASSARNGRTVNLVPSAINTSPPRLPEEPTQILPATIRTASPLTEDSHDATTIAYRQLLTGQLDAARTTYSNILLRNPQHADALHGLAVIAAQEGKTEEAASHFRRLLDIDPTDAIALAGVAEVSGNSDITAVEAAIRSHLSTHDGEASLAFALGNLCAKQQRWDDARQAYFQAMATDTFHPDYLFNLAVSLDHLRQPALAAHYYQQALEAARTHTPAFEPGEAIARLNVLTTGALAR